MSLTEVHSEPQLQPRDPFPSIFERFFLIFTTGFSEIRRKGAITRLHYEIRGLEREKEKYVHSLGVRAWEAHIHHPDLSATVVNLKELQIEMNRLKTQFGEHDTEIKDIESAKIELTAAFNTQLDSSEQAIVPHRQRIESINADKEKHKIQIEELRAKQNDLTQQISVHQQNIQQLHLGEDGEKGTKLIGEQEAISGIHRQKCEIDCKLPELMAEVEKLGAELSAERAQIETMEQQKEAAKREFEGKIKEYNGQIQQLEEKKKQASRQMEHYRREMEPFLYELGQKVEQLRLHQDQFPENFEQLDSFNDEIRTREKQILEAESLSRAMDRGAWNGFLVFSASVFVLVISALVFLLQ